MNSISALICFIFSTCYHTFMCCHKDYHKWISLDVCGVYVLLTGSQWHVASFSLLMMHQNHYIFKYMVIYYLMALIGIGFSVTAHTPILRGLPMLLLYIMRIALLLFRLYSLNHSNTFGTW